MLLYLFFVLITSICLSQRSFSKQKWNFFCLFTPYFSAFFVFPKKGLILWNLISRYMISTREQFLKNRNNVGDCKVNFYISKLFIQCNTGSCSVHIIVGVNIYLTFHWIMCVLCFCVISNQSASKNHFTWVNYHQIWCLNA